LTQRKAQLLAWRRMFCMTAAPDASGPAQGLTDAQAQARLLADGPNRLPTPPRRGLWRLALDAAMQPMFLLLFATAAVYAALGSVGDATILLLSVLMVAVISIYQQQRTEHVLAALKELASPRCRVWRDGRLQRIASQDLVQGDCLLLAEGDRLACDAQLQSAHSLLLDESLFSGESAPLLKAAGDTVSAGTLVVQGDGLAQVSATGSRTHLGRMGASLAQIKPPVSRAQAELKRLAKVVAALAACTCLLAASVYAWRQGSWVQGLLVGLTLAMALIPEEFAVVWTVLMALGAWRLSKQQVLTRQPQAIEALGTTSVLCVDKTGTLTVNRMSLVELEVADAHVCLTAAGAVPKAFTALLDAAAAAGVDAGIEPMDRAIQLLHARSVAVPAPALQLARRDGVGPGHPYLVNWWRSSTPNTGGTVVAKGAPEALQALCDLSAPQRQHWSDRAAQMTASGLRVLAVAQGRWQTEAELTASPQRLQCLGLLGFVDPLRDEVPAAMAQCRSAGIRVVMITGDAPLTALAIARSAGMPLGDEPIALSGDALRAMDEQQLASAVQRVSVFARTAPEQKLRIVRALQAQGHVVAMTGDGVNDATALRAADIGVAMGQRGTDVAREAAQLVLLDDSFNALVSAVRMGRRIFVNLQKSVSYLLAVHVPIVGISLIPVLWGGPLLLLPVHVVLLELIIDPACSLVFEAEPEAADCMQQAPRPAAVGLLSWRSALQALAAGALGLAAVWLVQWAALAAQLSTPWCRFWGLSTVILSNLVLLQWFRLGRQAWHRHAFNRAFAVLCAALALVYGTVLALPPLARVFAFPQHQALQGLGGLMMLAGVGAALWLWARRSAVPDARQLT
jgi:P-type Ca2+ transporter type 2C